MQGKCQFLTKVPGWMVQNQSLKATVKRKPKGLGRVTSPVLFVGCFLFGWFGFYPVLEVGWVKKVQAFHFRLIQTVSFAFESNPPSVEELHQFSLATISSTDSSINSQGTSLLHNPLHSLHEMKTFCLRKKNI